MQGTQASNTSNTRRYAATEIIVRPGAVTPNAKINATTLKLATILAAVMDEVQRTPDVTPQRYGQIVHEKFAEAVKAAQISGIAPNDVESTFSLEDGAKYGSPDSIRTDVILRDDDGKIIAIYDVKTGRRGLSLARIHELLAKTRAGPGTQIIILRFGLADVVKAT